MTTLDQAFIKAFTQRDTPTLTMPPQPTASALESPHLPLNMEEVLDSSDSPSGESMDEQKTPSDDESLSDGKRGDASSPVAEIFDDVLTALEKPQSQPTTCHHQPPPLPLEVDASTAEDRATEESDEKSFDDVDSPTNAEGPQPESLGPQSVPLAPLLESPASILSACPVDPSTARRELEPVWQVDRFTWPRACRRLIARVATEFDRLADTLLAASTRGQKVLAIAGCRRGEGATTLLLCIARQLAERGIKPVLVDADLTRPRLAKRLGVQPQVGWNETSEEGKESSLNQAIVEATSTNMALLALREPATERDDPANDFARLATCIESLRDHYEMVLVDLGPLEDLGPAGAALIRTDAGNIDAVLLVHNQRAMPEEQLDEKKRQLTDAGITVAGLIENFVDE